MKDNIKLRPWLELELSEMEEAMEFLGEPKFRARQLADWIYKKGVFDFQEMSNFSFSLRQKLEEQTSIGIPELKQILESKRDPVKKALLELDDGEIIETVLMKYSYGNSVCVSTQAGCKMGCTFCATGLTGFRRNLTVGEMMAQVLLLRQADLNTRVSHLVLMGMGEPLDNYDEVIKFIKRANASWALGIGYRHISVSTCGLIPQIKKLQQENLPINLSISLHAPNDKVRQNIMPIAQRYAMDELLPVLKTYGDQTKRRVTFEYNMIAGVNDREQDAIELATKLRGMLAFVNLIPLNPVAGVKLRRSNQETIKKFAEILNGKGIEATIRREMGGDINGACGQLRGNLI